MNTMINLTSNIQFYYGIRNIFIIIFVILLLITFVYGYKIEVISIILKKTGIEKRREIADMKAGKAIRKRVRQKEDYDQYTMLMSMEAEEELIGTTKLDELEPEVECETQLLSSNLEQEDFYLIKSNMIVHCDLILNKP